MLRPVNSARTFRRDRPLKQRGLSVAKRRTRLTSSTIDDLAAGTRTGYAGDSLCQKAAAGLLTSAPLLAPQQAPLPPPPSSRGTRSSSDRRLPERNSSPRCKEMKRLCAISRSFGCLSVVPMVAATAPATSSCSARLCERRLSRLIQCVLYGLG